MSRVSVDVDGLVETLAAFKGLEADLRKEANAELRVAGREAGAALALELRASASSSGVPVAPRVARSIKVKRDRIPVVAIGGAMPVGARGGSAGALAWGSEQGPKGAVNHFAVPPGAGYWIAPAVERYSSRALSNFRAAVADVFRKHGLL
jgi:hypothetical protein